MFFFGYNIECVKLLSTNPYVKRFASGKARSNVRFRDVLETKYIFDKEKMVTEYIVDDIDILIPLAFGDETDIVSQKWESASSSLSSRADNNNKKNDKPAAATKAHMLWPEEEGFVDVPLPMTRCDENSGIHGNSMMMMMANNGPRDPLLSVGGSKFGSYNRTRSIEISSTAASPSTPNDPPPTTMFLRHRQRVHY